MNIWDISATPRYLFMDMNSFFASCEQQDFPDLRNRPVAVVPSMTESTCAIAASYEAKAFGIKTGTKIYEAKKLCPGLQCVEARHRAYIRYHNQLLEEFVKYTPLRKIWSIDEWDSRLLPRHQKADAALALARQIKQGIKDNVGHHIKASIGLAPNSFLAKVATDMEKPDGLVILHPGNLKDRLFALNLMDLPGINVRMDARLRRCGIHTIEDLWNCPPKKARAVWGGVGGERFWYNLHGVQVPEIQTTRGMIGHSRVLDPEHRDPDIAYQIARRLASKAAYRLRREGYFTTRLSLSARAITRQRWGAEMRLPPTDEVANILKALYHLWHPHLDHHLPGRLLKVSVCMSGLIPYGEATGDLFEYAQKRQDHGAIDHIMEEINAKFGPQTINLGLVPHLRGAPIGTKIAFSRVPDLAEFDE